ncbi:MAG: helix-turn-helix domain-containing protein [Chloroflexota bacterium]|nr:helix-turn-helix domain-containing protein [Dehalococcoidales bacterium]
MNEIMTLEEVADYLRVHYTTVRRWCHGGELPALRVGRTYRIRKADLDAWWQERTQRPAAHGSGTIEDGE